MYMLSIVKLQWCCTCIGQPRLPFRRHRYHRTQFLVLLGTGSLQVLVLSRQDCGPAVDAAEGLGNDGRAVRTNGCADGHEEAVAFSQY